MTTFFSSDQHFGHENIIGYCDRPFNSVDHMNRVMINNWNAVVAPDDTVIVVGDFAMGRIEESLELALELNGDKILVPGNHDRCWGGYGKYREWVPKYEAVGFEVWPSCVDISLDREYNHDIPATVCHFPYAYDGPREANLTKHVDKFSGNRPPDNGGILICGHVHDAWLTNGKMVNVGVDLWDFTPVSEDDLTSLMEERGWLD